MEEPRAAAGRPRPEEVLTGRDAASHAQAHLAAREVSMPEPLLAPPLAPSTLPLEGPSPLGTGPLPLLVQPTPRAPREAELGAPLEARIERAVAAELARTREPPGSTAPAGVDRPVPVDEGRVTEALEQWARRAELLREQDRFRAGNR